MRKGRKGRRANRRNTRKNNMYGGMGPVGSYGAGSGAGPMELSLAQGNQFARFHEGQHGGGGLVGGPYPGAVLEQSPLPGDLVASAKLLPLQQAFAEIRQYGPSSDNPNLKGGKRRRRGSRKGSRKTRRGRKGSRKQRGGDFYRWGGGARRGRKGSRKSKRRGSRKQRGGSAAEMSMPMDVAESTKMLIPPSLQAQAGLNPEWKLAENPMAFAPK